MISRVGFALHLLAMLLTAGFTLVGCPSGEPEPGELEPALAAASACVFDAGPTEWPAVDWLEDGSDAYVWPDPVVGSWLVLGFEITGVAPGDAFEASLRVEARQEGHDPVEWWQQVDDYHDLSRDPLVLRGRMRRAVPIQPRSPYPPEVDPQSPGVEIEVWLEDADEQPFGPGLVVRDLGLILREDCVEPSGSRSASSG